jgi:hypothetical protein
MAHAHDNHGQTPAAWTAVTIIMIGFLVGCVAVVLLNWVLLGVAAGIIVVGGVVGKVMQMMGMGKQDDRGPGHDVVGTPVDQRSA